MNLAATKFIKAARCPSTLAPQSFGAWTIKKTDFGGFTQTVLFHQTVKTMHLIHGDVVMEDSPNELRKHLPIWLAAKGRVLVTGLGLGCVVRGLLASPAVEHVIVVEKDRELIRSVGNEFDEKFNPRRRVQLIHDDALTIKLRPEFRCDFAWHDLWIDPAEGNLQKLHMKLFVKFRRHCPRQGAWGFPREFAALMPWRPLGAPNEPRPRERQRRARNAFQPDERVRSQHYAKTRPETRPRTARDHAQFV
jgi:hypothetical protein